MAYQFKTTNVKGKQYVEVTERVKYFRISPEYKGWSIDTEIISMDGGEVVMKTTIKNSEGIIKSTGLAHEVQEASYINKTSYIENCETSAVGRALAMLAIGIDTSMASADEVEIAIAKDEAGITGKKTASKPAKKKSPVAKDIAVEEDMPENEKMKLVIKAVDYIIKGKNVPERNELRTKAIVRLEDMFKLGDRHKSLLDNAVKPAKK
tara:strand:+ start:1522 stop:2145 length:624 start_codon:yes stop_codon:yes gene_type:complete